MGKKIQAPLLISSPFPKALPSGEVVVDEQCTCHHMRTQHAPHFAFGHGGCNVDRCPCVKFTWARSILESDRQKYKSLRGTLRGRR